MIATPHLKGKRLKFFKKRLSDRGKIKRRQAIYKGTDCLNCAVRNLLTKQKSRTIARELREELQVRIKRKTLDP